MILIPSGRTILAETIKAQALIDQGKPLDGIRFAVIGYADERQFAENSVDLTLGRYVGYYPQFCELSCSAAKNQCTIWARQAPNSRGPQEIEYIDLAEVGQLVVYPGAIVFPTTAEVIYCGYADGVAYPAKLADTSTHVRRGGSSHANAGWIDPGFCNHLTLEEAPRGMPVTLKKDQVVCQIIFMPAELGAVYPSTNNVYQERTGKAPLPKQPKVYQRPM